MAFYKSGYNSNPQGYSNYSTANGYQTQRGNYQNNYSNYGGNRSAQYNSNGKPAKKSGCKFQEYHFSKANGGEKVDRPTISGWNVSKRHGFRSFVAGPHKTKARTTNPRYESWMVKMNRPGVGDSWHLGFYDLQKKKLYVRELGMVLNPNAPNGGYAGTFKKK